MNILVPAALAALVALPIIVLLHMRHTTPRLRPMPTLRFWLAAEPRRTEEVRFRRPPLSILLLLQLLIAAALAIALARPATTAALDLFGLDLRTEPRHLLLLLDGSTSMQAIDTPEGETRFEAARTEALRRLGTLRDGDVATVLLLGTRTTSFGATDAASLGSLRERLAVAPAPGGRTDLDAALALARDLLVPGLDDEVLVLSDGAVAADAATVAGLGAPVELALVGSAAGSAAGRAASGAGAGDGTGSGGADGTATGAAAPNLAIVGLSARSAPDNPELPQLYAGVHNFGAAEVTVPVVLRGDGLELGRQEVKVPPSGGAVELSWALPPDVGEVTVEVEGEDPLPADDVASLILQGERAGELALDILLLSDAPSALQRALAALPGARVTSEPTDAFPDVAAGRSFDLLVFERSLPPDGATAPLAPLLLVDPPPGGPFQAEGAMTAPTVARLRAEDPLLAGVDLAGATFGDAPIYALVGNQTEVVGSAEGPLIFRAEVQGQPAIVLAFDLLASNLPRRVAFPILIANAVRDLAPSPLPPSLPLGDALSYRPRAGAATVEVTPPDGRPVLLALATDGASTGVDRGAAGESGTNPAGGSPGDSGAAAGDEATASERLAEVVFTDTGVPGAYAVRELDAAGDERGGGAFTVNAGHARESDLRPNPELAASLAGGTAGAGSPPLPRFADLWPLLAMAALVLLVAEWALALSRRRGGRGWGQAGGAGLRLGPPRARVDRA